MKQSKPVNLGEGSVGKLIFKLSLPTITAQLINALYNMVDRVYIGHIPEIGETALTGVGVCMSLIMIVSAFASLTAMGGATRASILLGKGQKAQAEQVLGNCTTGVIAVSLFLTALLLLLNRPMLLSFGASPDTIGYATQYMNLYACGTIFVSISLGLNAFITAQGFTTVSMLSVLLGAVTNIILDPILIFACHMGVRGAALATVISQAISAAWVLRFLLGKKTTLRIQKENLPIRWRLYAPCLALGLSPFVMQSTEGVISICFNSSLQRFGGDMAVGAMTVLATVMQMAMLPLQGLTQGTQPLVSYNYGAGNADRVKKAFFLLLRASLLYSFGLWALAMGVPQIFAKIFMTDETLIAYTAWAMRIYMAVTLVFGAQIACQQTFIALGNAKTSLFLAVLRKIILLIPLIFLLPVFFSSAEQKVMAVFLAEPVADAIAVTTTVITFALSFRKVLAQMGEQTHEI